MLRCSIPVGGVLLRNPDGKYLGGFAESVYYADAIQTHSLSRYSRYFQMRKLMEPPKPSALLN